MKENAPYIFAFLALLFFLLILVAIGLYAWFVKIKPIWENVKFDFANAFKAINLGAFSIKDLIIGGQTKINPTLAILISNNNNEPLSFKNMEASVYHKGTLISNTTKELNDKTFSIPANSSLQVSDTINIYLNKAGGEILVDKLKGGSPELNYVIKVKIKLFGMWIPVSYEDKFIW